jgi:hypothetical protein
MSNTKRFKLSKALLAALPDEVPIPSAEQWTEGTNLKRGEACCLLGWCGQVLFSEPRLGTTSCAQDEMALELARFVAEDDEPTRWNDKCAPREYRAQRWEQKMRELGYEVVG